MQLDLFAHGRDVMLQNDVIAALRTRNVLDGRNALTKLAAEFPDHALLAPIATLLDSLTASAGPIAEHDEAASRLRATEEMVVPAAGRVFGHDEAREWLAPIWASLAQAAVGLSFQPRQPRTHAAFLLLRGGHWAAAEDRVATIPSWRRIPLPLAWMAEARFHRGGLEPVWCLLIELAWMEASTFRDLIARMESAPLRNLMDAFAVGLEDDGELDPSWFPAWLLVHAPDLASVMRQAQVGSGTLPERVARLIMELLALEKQGRHAALVANRRKLRDLHPGLYKYYMSTR